jgi:hypothetical protein
MKAYGDVVVVLILVLDQGQWSALLSSRCTPGERSSDTHRIDGWVGPIAVLYALLGTETRFAAIQPAT